MNGKKRGVSSREVILSFVAIFCFVVVLGFFHLWKSAESNEDDLCYLSVLSRATAGEISISAKGAVPLKCYTKKICLSDKDCKSSFFGEKNVVNIGLPRDNDKARGLIEKTTADEIYRCWKMMGEGKLDLFSTYAQSRGWEQAKPVCVICSRIAINLTGGEREKQILGNLDVKNYMRYNRVPGTEKTYIESISGGELKSVAVYDDEKIKNLVTEDNKKIIISDANQLAVVYSQIHSHGYGEVFKNLGSDVAVATAGIALTPGVGGALKGATRVIITVVGAKVAAVVVGVGVAAAAGRVAYNTYASQDFSAAFCGEFQGAGSDSKKGCSIVQLVPYNKENIEKICTYLDGYP